MPTKQKPKRNKAYNPDRFAGGANRLVDPAAVAATDELMGWLDAGAEGQVPTSPLSQAVRPAARRCAKQYARQRQTDEPFASLFDEFIAWIQIGADGLIPAVAPSDASREFLRAASDGLKRTRAERVRR